MTKKGDTEMTGREDLQMTVTGSTEMTRRDTEMTEKGDLRMTVTGGVEMTKRGIETRMIEKSLKPPGPRRVVIRRRQVLPSTEMRYLVL